MPLVSVLTAAYGPTARYLPDTMAAVRAQHLSGGWEWEWIVQEDGARPELAESFAGLDVVRYQANKERLGLAQTRNLGLSRAAGELVQVLDHDDVLLAGALDTLVRRFADPAVGWAVGQADDLMPDGRRLPYRSALPYGLLRPGAVNTWAADHGGNWPIHCASLMIRTSRLRAVGGWAALPADDDVAMFAALSEATSGYNEPAVTWLYRQHEQQTHRTPGWRNWSDSGRRIALQRALAVRATGLSFPEEFDRVAAGGKENASVEIGPARPKKPLSGN